MSVQQVPLGSVTIGAPAWRESTELSLRRACRLLRQTGLGPGGTATARPRTATTPGCPKHASTEDKTEKHGDTTEDDGNGRDHADSRGGGCSIARPQTIGTTVRWIWSSCRLHVGLSSDGPMLTVLNVYSTYGFKETYRRLEYSTLVPSQAASLRERCARQSTATAGEYMRWVREVELRLRRQAGRSSQEIAKLERERAHLEMMLRSLRNDLQVNRECAGQRTERRPVCQRDGADLMLAWERRELTEMKHDVEETLRKTQQQLQVLDESSRDLQMWSSQQALVLVLLPHRGSVPAPHPPPAATRTLPPTYGFTSESEQVLDSSSLAINQSQRLREQIRHALSEVVARQRASQHVVNGGLVKKVAETVTLERSLVLTAAATRHAASRKQREVDSLSHGRAQGPESSSDVFCRERRGRPLVQVYQRHPGTELPEATHLLQVRPETMRPDPTPDKHEGVSPYQLPTIIFKSTMSLKIYAVLGYRLGESEDDAARLRRCFLQLRGEARGKRAAARRDTTVVRMRLQRGDKRVIPHILQQGEPKVTQEV
ncbi:coiled-coil domain-containing protein 105 [Gadus chalcogrammus]|uniref:coiled-coil domain-containing protein 105 n=1 Tax=Gadus chalcogrammus TaxID=1042646 RepID=UPI0024C48C52|nr:coiled-coil domain-containing protein 105 [Gadus chalcogrammus]